ncbi:MAG TPA: ATP-binding protein [Chthoniobacteraceae bacterium]|nr:ATP-binding protein [Chthoniobacteraceae bacterium]
MNSPADVPTVAVPTLREIALAAVAARTGSTDGNDPSPEAALLRKTLEEVRHHGESLREVLRETLKKPATSDARLVGLGRQLGLTPVELLAIALAAAVEEQPMDGRVLAHVQTPVGGSRPTLGLMLHAFSPAVEQDVAILPELLNGEAVRSGLLVVLNESAPLPERPVMVPSPLFFGFAGHEGAWSGATIGLEKAGAVPLALSVQIEAQRHAIALEGDSRRTLVLRSGSPAEARSVANEIAEALARRPLFIDSEKAAGLGPWLILRELLPVFCLQLGPGERRVLPALPGYTGPVLVVCGPDGAVEASQGAAASWTIPVPSREERATLWSDAIPYRPLAERLAREHRHGAGRIAHLGQLARHRAAFSRHAFPHRTDVIAASWTGEGSGLDALAEPMRVSVRDGALIAEPRLQSDLEALMMRCRMRDELVAGLGVSATTRYRPGVRALFTGPSGTGKTLAAGWIASRLGLPLYRVDLASVTSKYIGETEKNLAQLLARAEQAEVILLFDEADSLFGKRTDISDSNDRFANAQTNYLLQRIENYEGIVLLTSNSQTRFDTAFARRIDFVIEFPPPGPGERRAIWRAHLGGAADLSPAELNQLAALLDFTGGHIRNTVLAAAVCARRDGRKIAFADLTAAAETELRKLGRQAPIELRPSRSSGAASPQ